MKSKLGAMVQRSSNETSGWLNVARPQVVKWLDFSNPGELAAVHAWGGKNIARLVGLTDLSVDNAVTQIQALDRALPGLFDYVELVNEPDASPIGLHALNDYTLAVQAKVKRPLIVGNLGEGNPPNLADWYLLYPAMRAVQAAGGALGVHEYGDPTLQASAPWHTLRYRLANALFPPDLQGIPTYVTELGVGILRGWRSFTDEAHYLPDLEWYDGQLQQDNDRPNVQGATLFVLGHDDPWADYEMIGTNTIASYIGKESTIMAGYIPGADISNLQGTVNWPLLAPCLDFVALKASEGITFKDAFFGTNWYQAGQHGLTRIAYHFGRPSQASGHAEAQFLLGILTAQGVNPGDLFCLDLEDDQVSPTADLLAYALDFMGTIKTALGVTPVLYSSRNYLAAHNCLNSAALASSLLWIASPDVTALPLVPAGWSDWGIWQYAQGVLPGVSGLVDLDFFKGTVAQLRSHGLP